MEREGSKLMTDGRAELILLIGDELMPPATIGVTTKVRPLASPVTMTFDLPGASQEGHENQERLHVRLCGAGAAQIRSRHIGAAQIRIRHIVAKAVGHQCAGRLQGTLRLQLSTHNGRIRIGSLREHRVARVARATGMTMSPEIVGVPQLVIHHNLRHVRQ